MVAVRPIRADEHRRFVEARGQASFLQLPSWAAVKSEWRAESLGWFPDDGGDPLGVGLVLYRQVPRLRRFLAYVPEGPVLDWEHIDVDTLTGALDGLVAHAHASGAFGVRLGPPVVARRWSAPTVKSGLAAGTPGRRLADLPPDAVDPTAATVIAALRRAGFRPPPPAGGFSAGQPRYAFWLPIADRSDSDLLAGFNQLWRRNIRKAERAGVVVDEATAADLPAFHDLYVETARRDQFVPRPLSYFQRMFSAMHAEDPHRIRLYLARHDGDLVAATTMVQVGRHAWYSYGASSTAKREVHGSHAVQWRMMRDARDAGACVYDLRGITGTLDPDDPLVGLVQFKIGTGGEAVEYLGEWDRPINRPLHAAVDLYLRRRGS